jgi:hypothetical protein
MPPALGIFLAGKAIQDHLAGASAGTVEAKAVLGVL